MHRHPLVNVAKGVVAFGGIVAALGMGWALLFAVGLISVDSGHREYLWWLVPLSLIPIVYVVVVVLALLDHLWAAVAVAAVAWLAALWAWSWLPGQFANEIASHTLPVALVVVTTGFALAATYLANALRDTPAVKAGGARR